MAASPTSLSLIPDDVDRACERDGKRYELIHGQLKEKSVGWEALFVASRIGSKLNAQLFPWVGFAVVSGMIWCFGRLDQGRKPDMTYAPFSRVSDGRIPKGDLEGVPNLVAEVLSPGTSATDMLERLDEYLEAGIPLVWIVNANRRTIRAYRNDGTTRLYHAGDLIENEPLLPGFRLSVGEVSPIG